MNWLGEMGEEEEEEEAAKGGGGDDINLSTSNTSPATIITAASASEPHGPATNPLSSVTIKSTITTTEAVPLPPQPPSPPPPPTYPQSFNRLIELITTGQPIPGIKEVPDTLLTGQGSKAVESKRKKPWEVHREQEPEIGGARGMEENDIGCGIGDSVAR